MGRKCAVPHCYTGYRKCLEKASLYKVPDDDFFLNKWQEAIARSDRPITPKDYVCEKHFKDDDISRSRVVKDIIEVYQRPKLKPDAVPSIFPELPEFILKMVKKRRKVPDETDKSQETKEIVEEMSTDHISKCNNSADDISEGTEVKEELVEIATSTISANEIEIKTEIDETTVEHKEDSNDPISPKMHRCEQCNYETKYPHNLRTHQQKHLKDDEALLRCDQCPNFKTKWELTFRNHLKIKHGLGKQEVYGCNLCQFKTKVKLCLKRHYDRHNKDLAGLKYKCEYPQCEYEVTSKALLVVHKLIHKEKETDEKSFRCTECHYGTNSKPHIIKHIKSAHQTGEDTVVFVNKDEIIKRTRPKNSEKLVYNCTKCSYKSQSQLFLQKHVAKHNQEELKTKIWKCPNCTFASPFQRALEAHQQYECCFQCTECSYKSSTKNDYMKHVLTHRNTSVEVIKRYKTDYATKTKANSIDNHSKLQHSSKMPNFNMVVVKEEINLDSQE